MASLKVPGEFAGGGNGEGGSDETQAGYGAYEAQKSALESKITELQQRLQELQTEAQQLQNAKTLLSRDLSSKQAELARMDGTLQSMQNGLDAFCRQRADERPLLQDALEEDGQLRYLQEQLADLQQQVAEKQSRFDSVNSQIEELESGDEGLLAEREEAADCAFKEAAGQIDFDAAGAEVEARASAAQELYDKSYEDLTEEENWMWSFAQMVRLPLKRWNWLCRCLPMTRIMPQLRRCLRREQRAWMLRRN